MGCEGESEKEEEVTVPFAWRGPINLQRDGGRGREGEVESTIPHR